MRPIILGPVRRPAGGAGHRPRLWPAPGRRTDGPGSHDEQLQDHALQIVILQLFTCPVPYRIAAGLRRSTAPPWPVDVTVPVQRTRALAPPGRPPDGAPDDDAPA